MQGFKSFADKIHLEFPRGITTVVGPNGSGKSNISDAIRWVMGEMSAKSLRGSKMEDVIFSGTEKRKQLGFAEVTIIIDNSDHALNIDFDEVSVTRRVYRSGESEYFINKAPCRLKDIHELFMDTGLGRDGYSIVGQGKIDEILSVKSEQRRHIFDEAAGITKYRFRRDEAEHKLNAATDNLSRVKDIIGELENQLEPLRIQSEKAKKYLVLKEEQKVLEVNVWLRNIAGHKEQLEQSEGVFNAVQNQLNQVKATAMKVEVERDGLKERIREVDSQTDKAKAAVFGAKNEITRKEGEISLAEGNIQNNTQNISRLKAEGDTTQNRIVLLEEQSIQHREQLLILEEKAKQNEAILEVLYETEAETAYDLERSTNELNNKKEQLSLNKSSLAEARAKKSGSGEFLSAYNQRIDALKGQHLELLAARETIAQEIEDLAKQQGDAAIIREQKEQQLLKAEQAIEEQRINAQGLKAKFNGLQNDIETMLSKKSFLVDLDNEFEGYPKSVKAVMNRWRSGSLSDRAIYGPLSQLIKVKKEYITAIEAALGASMQSIVTENEEDAKASIAYLKASSNGRVTFLPVSSVKARSFSEKGVEKHKGYIAMAAELVEYDNKFTDILSSLLGATVVMDNIDNAILLARAYSQRLRIVTLQGEILNTGGSITGGSLNNQGSALSRSGDILALDVKIKELNELKEQTQKRLAEVDLAIQVYNDSLAGLKQQVVEAQTLHTRLTAQLENSKRELLNQDSVVSRTNSDIEDYNKRIKDAQQAAEGSGDIIKRLEYEIAEISDEISALEVAIGSLVLKREQSQNAVTEARIAHNNSSRDARDCEDKLMQILAEAEQLYKVHQEKLNEAELLIKNNEQAKGQIDILGQDIEALRLSVENADSEVEQLIKAKADIEQEELSLEDKYKACTEDIIKLQAEFGRLEANKAKIEAELESITDRLWDEYELTYTTALEYKKEIASVQKAQQRINELKTQIKNLGNINIDAITEYTSVKERYEFLSSQREDLENARLSLLKLIEDMTLIMKKQFEENFALLSTKFTETFIELFGGGKAQLKLSEPENILGSGIEIEVQPPGKKLQSITLLSGGEKAFTAIAILFAILKVRPTHFCIFDEIEAALDDVNVFRFADYLKRFSQNTQFIVITHRKGTMEAANTMYGIIMQEKGVSTLLELDFDKLAI